MFNSTKATLTTPTNKAINTDINAIKKTVAITAKRLTIDSKVTTAALFSHFSHQPWAMWLDSCNSEHIDSRFDILVYQPLATLTTQGENTQISFPQINTQHTSTDDPLLLIQQLQKQLFDSLTTPDKTLPFLGGALGYFFL